MSKAKLKASFHLVLLVVGLAVYSQALTGNGPFDSLYLNMAVLQPIIILVGFFSCPYYIGYIIRQFRSK